MPIVTQARHACVFELRSIENAADVAQGFGARRHTWCNHSIAIYIYSYIKIDIGNPTGNRSAII